VTVGDCDTCDSIAESGNRDENCMDDIFGSTGRTVGN
jgi:hypothetical protein